MHPHTKFGIPTSKNIGDMDRTQKRDGRTHGQTHGRTDGRTDSAITICLPKFLWGHKNIKLVFEVTINIQSSSKWHLTTSPHFICNIYKPVSLQNNFFWCFDAGLEHMAARSRGNGTHFDWLRKSCDIST